MTWFLVHWIPCPFRKSDPVKGSSQLPGITNLPPVVWVWGDSPWQGDPWDECCGQTLVHHTDTQPVLTSPMKKGKQLFFFSWAPSPAEGVPASGCLHVSALPKKHWGLGRASSFPAGAEHLTEGDRAVLLLSLKMANLGSLIWCCSQVWVLTALYLRAGSSPPSCATWTAPFTPSYLCQRIPQVLDTLQDFRSAEVRLGLSLSLSPC